MEKAIKVLIFTDLDGSLLHRDTFKFDEIKDYLKQLKSKGIFIIPNTSKTEKEILQFNYELGSNLPFISENGAAINGLDLLNSDLPKELILSREKDDIFNIFKNIVPLNLQNKCKWLSEMNGLKFDSHSEEKAVELFSKNIIKAGEDFYLNPMDAPFIPTWSRVKSAIPDFLIRLEKAVNEDNKYYL